MGVRGLSITITIALSATVALTGAQASSSELTSPGPQATPPLSKPKPPGESKPAFYSFYAAPPNYAFSGLEKIDTKTGLGTPVWTIPDFGSSPDPVRPDLLASPFGLAFDVDGSMYTIVSWIDLSPALAPGPAQLASINPLTGALTYIGPPLPMHYAGPDIDGCGNLYATGFNIGDPVTNNDPIYIHGDTNLHRIDKYTGQDTIVGDTGLATWMDLAFDSRGTLWAVSEGNKLYTLDTTTGAATFVTDIYGVPQSGPNIDPANWGWMEVMTIAFDERDVLWATAIKGFSSDLGNAPVMRIDTVTGNATVVGWTNQAFNHGGDILPKTVRVCHRNRPGRYQPLTIPLDALPAHRAHGDIVPGTEGHGCHCP